MSGDIINKLFSIDNDLKMGYQLKELFLDIVYHVGKQLNDFIDKRLSNGVTEGLNNKNVKKTSSIKNQKCKNSKN